MPDHTTPIPCRRPELVGSPLGENGAYLVRDRRAGESFTLGPEEYFLLTQLDGTRKARDLCAAFAERFGEPLTEEELDDFLHLASQRGLLQKQGDREAQPDGTPSRPVPSWEMGPPQGGRRITTRRTASKRLMSVLLGAVAWVFQWLADLLEEAVGWIRFVKLIHFDFVPRPDDIFIVTYPRSGTTWMQMILYQLTTDGSMDFPHICEYCPWFERSSRSAGGFEGRPSPRLFKSHLPYRQIPKGPCKYVYIARDGKDVAVSYFHFYRSHLGFRGTFDEFFDRFMRGRVEGGSWSKHFQGWWDHRDDANVLFLCYEELLHDLERCLRRIIAFCDLDVEPARFPNILERCGFAFMKAHESKFDHTLGALWEEGVQWNAFIRQGRTGAWKDTLSPQQAARLDRIFGSEIGQTGIDQVLNGWLGQNAPVMGGLASGLPPCGVASLHHSHPGPSRTGGR